jgi:hypothetical protein
MFRSREVTCCSQQTTWRRGAPCGDEAGTGAGEGPRRARADHPGSARHEVRQQPRAQHGQHQAAEEALPGLLGRQLDQRRAPEEEACRRAPWLDARASPPSQGCSQADAPAPRSAACLDRQHRKRCSAPCARSAYRRVTERASVKGWYQHADWGAGRAAWRQVLGRAGTRQVGANVVDDDQRAGQQEPDDAVEDVGHEERGRHKYEEQDQVRPRVLPELVQVAALLQAQHERHEACRGRPAPRASSCPPSARRPRLGSSMIWGACQSHMLGLRTRRNARTKQ